MTVKPKAKTAAPRTGADVVASIVEKRMAETSLATPEAKAKPEAPAVAPKAAPKGAPDFLDRAPPRKTVGSMTLREVTRAAKDASKGAAITFSESQWERIVELVAREFGDCIEAAGFVWDRKQMGRVKQFTDDLLRDIAIYDGLAFRKTEITTKQKA